MDPGPIRTENPSPSPSPRPELFFGPAHKGVN